MKANVAVAADASVLPLALAVPVHAQSFVGGTCLESEEPR